MMLDRIRKFFALERGRRWLFLSAFYYLGRARWLLWRRPFRELVAGFERCGVDVSAPGLEAGQLEVARDIGWAVRTASAYTPWKSACLVQVLAAQRLLAGAGIGGVFYLGAGNDGEEGQGDFMAHAWLCCGGEFITGEAGAEQYTALTAYRWQ